MKKPSYLKTLLTGLMGALSAMLPLLFAVAPGFFSHLLYTGGIGHFLAALIIAAAGTLVLFGVGGLFAPACILVVSVLLYFMIKRKAPYFEAALFTAAAITVMLYLLIGMDDILSGARAFFTVQNVFRQMMAEMLATMRAAPELFTGAQLQAYEAAGNTIAAMLPMYMPAALCMIGALSGLCNVVIAARLNSKAHAGAKPLPHFSLWQLPKSFSTGAAIMVAGVIIASFADVPALEAVISAVSVVIIIPAAIQGLCLFWFLRRMRRIHTLMFVALVFVIVLTFPTSMLTLAGIGLMEQLFHIRRRMLHRDTDKNVR